MNPQPPLRKKVLNLLTLIYLLTSLILPAIRARAAEAPAANPLPPSYNPAALASFPNRRGLPGALPANSVRSAAVSQSPSLPLPPSSPPAAEASPTRALDFEDFGIILANGALPPSTPNQEPHLSPVNQTSTGFGDYPIWTSSESDDSCGLAWGDYDNDGDLDLVFANRSAPLRLYRNDGGTLTHQAAWSSPEVNNSCDVAWGDYDGNGYLDLAVANMNLPDRVYKNEGGSLTLAWETPESADTHAVAWGDPDFDGYLELATTGDSIPTQIYENQNGELVITPTWHLEDRSNWQEVYRDYVVPGQNCTRPDYILWDIDAVGARSAWAVGSEYDYPESRPSFIRYTRDGGVTWNEWFGDGGKLFGVDFVDEQVGWAVGSGGTIFHTIDGGTTWNQQVISATYDLWDVNFLNAQEGWIVGGKGRYYQEQDYIILHTSDSGETWDIQQSGSDFTLRAVTFVDEQTGWAVGSSSNGYVILNTIDAGVTWNLLFGGSSGNYLEDITFNNPLTGWAVGFVGNTPSILFTDDGGATWNAISDIPFKNGAGLQAIEITEDNVGWATGGPAYSGEHGFILQADLDTNSWAYHLCNPNNFSFTCQMEYLFAYKLMGLAVGDYNTLWAVGFDEDSSNFGGCEAQILHSPGLDFGRALAWVDYDDDGNLDLSVGRYGWYDLIYRNDGSNFTSTFHQLLNRFGAARFLYATNKRTTDIAWADINGDDRLDLATIENGQVAIYTNTGELLPVLDQTFGSGYEQLAWGEWFSDGGSVPALAAVGLNNSAVYQYNADGTFSPVWEQLGWGGQDIAWGDYNGDRNLDLAIAANGPNKLYRRVDDKILLNLSTTFGGGYGGYTTGIWTDHNGDQLLDYIVGSSYGASIYINEGHEFILDSNTQSGLLAAGDYDNDGDLDLSGCRSDWQEVRVERNDDGVLTNIFRSQTFFPGVYKCLTAWADYDQDGDLDLAYYLYLGGSAGEIGIFRNDGDTFTRVWWDAAADGAEGIFWADYDNDRDLDFIDGRNLYRNDNGSFTFVNSYGWDGYGLRGSGWADYDGDGDLDLLASDGLHRNDNGVLTSFVVWTWPPHYPNPSLPSGVGWGDFDNDGDLDIAVTRNSSGGVVYRNHNGQFSTPSWHFDFSYSHEDETISAGDWDNDGDLELSVAHHIFSNDDSASTHFLPNTPPRIYIEQPGYTDKGEFYHRSEILVGPYITITYRLYDEEYNPARYVRPQYSLQGGGQWFDATPAPVDSNDTTNLEAAPYDPVYGGERHTFVWDAYADGVHSDNVVFRISVTGNAGPILEPAFGASTTPFRVWIPDFTNSYFQASVDVVSPGDILTYTVLISNPDIKPAIGTWMQAGIPTHTTYISGTATASNGAPSIVYQPEHEYQLGFERAIRWRGIVSPTSSVTITFAVQVEPVLINGTVIENSAALNGYPIPGGGTVTTTVRSLPDFASSILDVDRARAQPGEILTYTARLLNQGDMHLPLASYSNILPAELSWVGNVQIAPPGMGATGYSNGVFQWMGPLTVGVPITLSYQLQLNDLLPIDTPIANYAALSDGISHTLSLTAPLVVVYSQPTLNTSTLDAPARLRPGDPLPYTLYLRNTGTMHAPNANASGALPAGASCIAGSFQSSLGSGRCINGNVSWDGPLNVNTPVSITYLAQTESNLPADTLLPHTITVHDNITGSTTRSVTTTIAIPDLTRETQFVVDKSIAMLGETVAFTLTFHNSDIDAPQVEIAVPFPDYLAYQPNSIFGSAVFNAGLKQIEWNGALAENETAMFSFKAVVSAAAPPGSRITTSAVINDGYNPPLVLSQTIRAGVPDLSLSAKSVDRPYIRVGGAATYTFSLVNANGVDANAVLTDPLPEGISFISASPEITYNAGQNRLEWSGFITRYTSITFTALVSVSSILSDGVSIANILYLDDGADFVYTRSATVVTVRPQDSHCLENVCVYADSMSDLGGGQWRASGRVRIGSLSQADVFLDEGGYVILDTANNTINGEGRLSLLANRLYPVFDGSFTVNPASGLIAPGANAAYLFDELSGFTVLTNSATLDIAVNVLQGTMIGTAQIQSQAASLDITTEVDFALDERGTVDALAGATDFTLWELPLTISGGYLDEYGLILDPEVTLPGNIATVPVPALYLYPDGVFASYVEFEESLNINVGGWEIAANEMLFDSDYGLVFPTAIITLPGNTTALLTDLSLNPDGSIAAGTIQGDFDFYLAGFTLSAHNAALSDGGLNIVSATLTFPFTLTQQSNPLALTFNDLIINPDGTIQSGGLNTTPFAFEVMGWEVEASGLILNAAGVSIPQLDLTLPTQPIDLGGKTYHFLNVGVTADGQFLATVQTDPQHFDIGDWRIDAAQGLTLGNDGLCVPEARLTLPYYLGRQAVYFDGMCLDPIAGVRPGTLSADFSFSVKGWSLQASQATFVNDELHVLTTTLSIPALDNAQVEIRNLQLSRYSPYIIGGNFATDIQADLFGLQARIPHDKVSLDRTGLKIAELTIRLPAELHHQEITLSNLNASPDKITLRSNTSFEVAGFKIEGRNSSLSAGGFHAGVAKLVLPDSLGKYRTTINNVRINANGLSINGGNVDIRLPSFNIGGGDGLGIRDARIRLSVENGSYIFNGQGKVTVPGMMAVDSEITFSTPDPPTWPYELRHARIHIHGGGFRVPLDGTGIFITGIKGDIIASNPIKFGLTFDYEAASRWVVYGNNVGGWVDSWGQFGVTGSAIALGGFVESYMDASITRSQGFLAESYIRTNPNVLEGSTRIHIWLSNGKTHFTASGRLRIRIPKGLLLHSRNCIELIDLGSCRLKCWGDWWWPQCSMKCRTTKHCLTIDIPPSDWDLFEVGADLGEFKNGKWGAKAFVSIMGCKAGVYVDTGGGFDVTNLDRYQLLDSRIMRAQASTLTANSVVKETIVPDTSGGVIFAMGWITGTPSLTLIDPVGRVITPAVALTDEMVTFESFDAYTETTATNYEVTSAQMYYVIAAPQPGTWQVIVENAPAPDMYEIAVVGASKPPAILVELPAVAESPADPIITIQGRVDGVYTDTILSLYTILTPTAELVITDINELSRTEVVTVYSGQLLAENVPINEDGSWQYTWNTSEQPRPAGVYYVYANVEDEKHPPVHAYAPGSVLVVDDTPPVPPQHMMVAPDENELSVTWAPNTEADLSGYYVHYRPLTDTRIITAVSSFITNTGTVTNPHFVTGTKIISYVWGITETVDVGNMTHFTLSGLDNGLPYLAAVSAYDLSGNESALSTASAVVTNTAPTVCNTSISLETLALQEVIAGETALITLTARTTASPAATICDFVRLSGKPVISGTAYAYVEQESLYLFADGDHSSTRVQLHAPSNVPPGDYTIAFTATVGGAGSYASTVLRVLPGPAYAITLTPAQTAIPGDGVSQTELVVHVTDAAGHPVADGTPVNFSADVGTLAVTQTTTISGAAQTTLTSSVVGPVTATVTAEAGDARGITHVAFQWADLAIVNATPVQKLIYPGYFSQFSVTIGNLGNKVISDVVISAALPDGLLPVHNPADFLGLPIQDTGEPYRWTTPVIEAGRGGLLTVTTKLDPDRKWATGDRLTIELNIAASETGQDFTLDNNTAQVVFIVGDPPSLSSIYLPLILRNMEPPQPQPLIGEPVPEFNPRPVTEQGETFYTTTLSINDDLSTNGHFYFSSLSNQIEAIVADDQLALVHDGTDIFTHTFSAEGSPPEPAIVEVSRLVVEKIAEGDVILEYRDVYGSVVGASEVYLIWSPSSP